MASFLIFVLLDYSYFASDPDHPEVEALPNWTFMTAGIFLFIAYTLGKYQQIFIFIENVYSVSAIKRFNSSGFVLIRNE